jgi:hypothetical protein
MYDIDDSMMGKYWFLIFTLFPFKQKDFVLAVLMWDRAVVRFEARRGFIAGYLMFSCFWSHLLDSSLQQGWRRAGSGA